MHECIVFPPHLPSYTLTLCVPIPLLPIPRQDLFKLHAILRSMKKSHDVLLHPVWKGIIPGPVYTRGIYYLPVSSSPTDHGSTVLVFTVPLFCLLKVPKHKSKDTGHLHSQKKTIKMLSVKQ
jgi:hypothetical protein